MLSLSFKPIFILALLFPSLAAAQRDCRITRDQYLELEEEMTVDIVQEILICEGRRTDESQMSGVNFETWEWHTFDPPGAITVMFSRGRLISKRNWNLQ